MLNIASSNGQGLSPVIYITKLSRCKDFFHHNLGGEGFVSFSNLEVKQDVQ